MQCPACTRTLEEHAFDALEVDICRGGCGGIWFDRFELQQVDEAQEVLGKMLVSCADDEVSEQPRAARYKCPRCAMVMMRHLFKPDIRVEIDTCPKCAGIWLDYGELKSIRGADGTDAERQKAAERYISAMFEQALKTRNSD